MGLTLSLLTRLIGRRLPMEEILIGLFLIVPAAIGFLLSGRLIGRVEGGFLRLAVFTLSTIAAAGLIGRAIFG